MSVVQPGGDQRRRGQERAQRAGTADGRVGDRQQRPGQAAGSRAGQARRPPVKGQPRGGAPGRGGSPGRGQPPGRPGQGQRRDGKGRRNVPVQVAPRRFSPTTIAIGSIALVVVVVVALVIVKVTGSTNNSNTVAPTNTAASATVVSAITNVPASVMDAVGVPSSSMVAPPSVDKHQSLLTYNGKPGAFFVGALFCPYCAAERWALIVALSKFGTFSGLRETTSSPWDTDPSTPTVDFYGSKYTSNYVVFKPIENESNDTTGLGTRHQLQPLTSQEASLDAKYSAHFGLSSEGYPFVDIGNKVFVTGPSYDPATLAGLNQNEVASDLKNPSSPITQSIVGTANYLIAGICSVTGAQPSSVCSVTAVQQASHALGLS